MPITYESLRKAREHGMDDDRIVASIERNDPALAERFQFAREQGLDNQRIISSLERKLKDNPQEEVVSQIEPTKKQRSLIQTFEQGLSKSASGSIVGTLDGHKSPEELTEDAPFWQHLVEFGGTITGDVPFMAAGSTLGGLIGGAAGSRFGGPGAALGGVGGALFGTLAFPAFIKESLKEYRDYVDKGNDLTFGEFLQQADRVASNTLREGAFGIILGGLNKLGPMLEQLPGVGKLFTSKYAQKGASIASETLGAATIPPATRGELPSGQDYALALATILGFNVARIPSKLREQFQARGAASGKTPEEFWKSIPREEIERIAEMLKQDVETPTKQLADVKADIRQSTPEAKTRNQKQKITVEPAREDITQKRPDNTSKSTEALQQDRESTTKLADELPQTNKGKLAREAVKRGYVETPQQLDQFLDEYESAYPTLPGKTGLRKNAKFLNKYATKAQEKREITKQSTKQIVDVRPSGERQLEIGKQQIREAKASGDKAKIKEAQKRIDLAKRRIQREAREASSQVKKTNTQVSKQEYKADKDINKDILAFTTEKGSKYTVKGNKTTRDKAYRPEHGEAEQGSQPTSQETIYVDKASLDKLSEFQTSGPSKVLYKYPDGRVGVYHTSGSNAGKVSANSVVTPSREPSVGLYPVEVWDNGRRVHFGNKIDDVHTRDSGYEIVEKRKGNTATVSVKPRYSELVIERPEKPNKKPKAKPTKPKKPVAITEETGVSVQEHIDLPKTTTERAIEKIDTLKKAATNPDGVMDWATAKIWDFMIPLERLETNVPVSQRVSTKIKQAQNAASDINGVIYNGVYDNIQNAFVSDSLADIFPKDQWVRLTKNMKPGEYSMQEFDEYRTARQILKRQQRGLKSGIDTREAQETVATLGEKYAPIEQRIREFQSKLLDTYSKDLLNAETREQWKQDAHTSLYRVMDYGSDALLPQGSLQPGKTWFKAKGSNKKVLPASESELQNLSMLITNSKKNDSVLQYKRLVEQGQLPGRVVKSASKPVPEGMLESLDIDPQHAALAEELYNQSRKDAYTPSHGRLRGWENGKPFEIEVPQEIYDIYSTLAPSDTGVFTKILQATNRLMSKGIVLEPVKASSIFLRDAANSLVYSKSGWDFRTIVKAYKDIIGNKESWQKFQALGGNTYASRLAYRSERSAKVKELL